MQRAPVDRVHEDAAFADDVRAARLRLENQRGVNVDDRHFAGMGLGLYICKGIAEEHGGHIWASSPGPGQGTMIHVVLPVHALRE